MELPRAVLIAAAMIAGAILGAPLIAPYRMSAAPGPPVWRLNTVTGTIDLCRVAVASQTPPAAIVRCD